MCSRAPTEARQVLGVALPGPVDFTAFLTVPDEHGAPWSCATFIEIKNYRQWFYPADVEVLYFLKKAALVQVTQPSIAVLPILVCRLRHAWTLDLARNLGFFSVQFFNQWLTNASGVTQSQLN